MPRARGNVILGQDTRTLAQVQADLLIQNANIFAAKIAAGYPVSGQVVQIDDGSRANLTGLATTALAVQGSNGSLTWPADYATGWVAVGGARIPLPGPSDGLTLAFGAGAFYANLVQTEQNVANAINAATTIAAAQAALTSGWPA